MTKHIVFWLGRAPTTWDHHTAIEKGIGGSELAALRLTSALVARGYKVTVYADILTPDKETQNPCWLPYDHDSFPSALLSCDLLVSSRCPTLGLGAKERKKRGKPTWLWMHDLHVGADWGNTLGTCFDKVVCLTRFAKERFCQYYPLVSPALVDIIPNGITAELYALLPGESLADKHKRLLARQEPLSVVWSSCADRGLDRVLAIWPLIAKAHPGAKLSIFGDFYGWQSRTILFGSTDQRLFAQKLAKKLLLSTTNPKLGVTFMGKAGQSQLAKAFMQAHLWFYPTSFEETSCITAMEAQAAGTKIACSAVGALPETAPYAKFLPAWEDTEAWETLASSVVQETLKEANWYSLDAARSRCLCWAQIALLWDMRIKELDKPLDLRTGGSLN
jgi:glycosyltransferase involved in cell wall biosynthesis